MEQEYDWLTVSNLGAGYPTLYIVTSVWYALGNTDSSWGVYSPYRFKADDHRTPTREDHRMNLPYKSVWGRSSSYCLHIKDSAEEFAAKHGLTLVNAGEVRHG